MLSVKHILLAILLANTGLLLGHAVRGTQTGTTCSVAFKGTSGSITCHFSVNLNVTKKDFSVRRSRLDGRDTEWVVDCTWVSSDRTKCFINSLYTFNGEVSQEAVIYIPELRDEDEKRYWCQVVASENSLVETCSFISPDQRGTQQTTKHFQEVPISNNDVAQSETFSLSPGDITGIVVGVIAVVAAVILLVIVLSKHMQKKEKNKTKKLPTTGQKGEGQLRPIYNASNSQV